LLVFLRLHPRGVVRGRQEAGQIPARRTIVFAVAKPLALKIGVAGTYPFRQRADWVAAKDVDQTATDFNVEDLLAERGVAVCYETVRRWVNHFGPMIAADLRKRRLKPHTTWHLDEVYLKIDGRMVYLWRAVDAEGEVLDLLVQSKRNKHAALKLMRKLLKKYALFQSGWSPTTCDRTPPRLASLGSNGGMSVGDGRTTELRIRISRRGGGSARCSGSRAPAPRRDSSRAMLPSTTRSTSNVISLQPKRTARSALRRWTRGGPQSQRPDNS
jgi:hypothetical protein